MSASNGERTQAIDAAVQRNEYTVDVYHRNRTDVMVSHSEPLMNGIIGILLGMLDGQRYLNILRIAPIQLHDLHQHTLTVLVIGCSIQDALVAQLTYWNVGIEV